ncbi:hypothetical protein L2X99_05850 [Microbacterium sp. KUDC0406]|uniref:hypothetical protein n=1 Tax=Microbacterium sp. KUDC0406 TaxID=2909588 RepID=UPI001F1ED9BB|nr:hypothetical protein [Microbacterium sp. KUDC0406]UJP11100.1 hypothetical protein L2X99_05850 [Microbacterium sp. KUDC0406]
MLAEIESGLADPRAALRRIERWESELTELAAPRPLRREVFAPTAAGTVVAERFPAAAELQDDDGAGRLARMAERFALATERVGALRRSLSSRRRRGRATGERRMVGRDAGTGRPTRRRPLLIGAAAAAIVLGAGLLWPAADGDAPASAQGARETAEAQRSVVPTASAAPSETVRTEDPVEAAPALVKRIERCVRDRDDRCSSAVVDGSASAVLTAVEDADAGDSASLVDSYGDIAVIRLGAPDQEQQILVLLRQKDEWLVRDVYAVADQPGPS